jgi:hypothetical protein
LEVSDNFSECSKKHSLISPFLLHPATANKQTKEVCILLVTKGRKQASNPPLPRQENAQERKKGEQRTQKIFS